MRKWIVIKNYQTYFPEIDYVKWNLKCEIDLWYFKLRGNRNKTFYRERTAGPGSFDFYLHWIEKS